MITNSFKLFNKFLSSIGSFYLFFVSQLGSFLIFIANLFQSFFSDSFSYKLLKSFFVKIGYFSILIISLTAFFTGAVLSLQLHGAFKDFGSVDIIPKIIFISLIRELGPVLGALMICARAGSSMTAEIGSMKINNQIDTLLVMSANPFGFLFLPRIIAMAISLPILLIIMVVIGIFGSYLTSVYLFNFSSYKFISFTIDAVNLNDIYIGLFKTFVFGLAISITSCYCGYKTKDGAIGVGFSTVQSVVASCVMILFFNLIISYFVSN